MVLALTDDLGSVLNTLLGLYGTGQPSRADPIPIRDIADNMLSGHRGSSISGYDDARAMRASVAATHADKDNAVHKVVGTAGDGTVKGRDRINNDIADLHARMRAIASIGDTRFSGPAMLDVAHTSISGVTRQVDADVVAAQKQAAQISPPPVPAPRHRSATTKGGNRRRRRRRSGVKTVGASRSQRTRRPLPSDGTAGGNAVHAASGWLDTPYVFGGGGAGGPSSGGFDCSGLTQYAIAQATDGRVHLPRTTYEQMYSGERVPVRDVRPGDLVFPASSFSMRGPEHVQLAAGNGMVIEAPHAGSTVRTSPMPGDAVVVRVLGEPRAGERRV